MQSENAEDIIYVNNLITWICLEKEVKSHSTFILLPEIIQSYDKHTRNYYLNLSVFITPYYYYKYWGFVQMAETEFFHLYS